MKDESTPSKTTAQKTTESAKKIRPMVKRMYTQAHEAKEKGQLVAYAMTASQYDEILRAMDIVPVWTENYGGLCAAKRVAERFLGKAEEEGYANEICGYVRNGLGFDAMRYRLGEIPPDSPDGGMAKPDLLLGSSAVCDPRYKWYQVLERYMDVPMYSIDILVPPVDADLREIRNYYISYHKEQFRGFIGFLEKQCNKKMEYDRLAQTIALGNEAWYLWWECDQLRKAIPSPMPSEDHYNAMVPAVFMSGTQEAVDYYRELHSELKQRVSNREGVIPEEKSRLMLAGGLPPWHTMWIWNYIESLGAVSVIERAYRLFDPVEIPSQVKDPVEQLAWRTFYRFTQYFDKAKKRSGDPVVEQLLEMISEYKIDGMIFHATRSCRATTIGQLHLMRLVNKYVKIPALQLTSDIVDVRLYSEEDWRTQINTFIESVNSLKR